MRNFFVKNWYIFAVIALIGYFAAHPVDAEAHKEKAYNKIADMMLVISQDPMLEYVLSNDGHKRRSADANNIRNEIHELRGKFHFWTQDASDEEFNNLIGMLRKQGLDIDAKIIHLPFNRKTYDVVLKTTYGDLKVYEEQDF